MILSVIIPTKNASDLIDKFLDGAESVFVGMEGQIEFLIVDNSSVPHKRLSKNKNKLFTYSWTSEDIGMQGNFDKGISIAKGKYLCVIGSDDAVLPNILDITRLMDSLDIDTAMCEVIPHYWKDTGTLWVRPNPTGYMKVPKSVLAPKPISLSQSLEDVLERGGAIYQEFMPSVYHGIVRKKVMLELIETYGTCFPGPSPDISNAILVASTNATCLRTAPFLVAGAAEGSAAAEGANHAHQGSLEDWSHMVMGRGVSWPAKIPKFFSGSTMWSISVLNTLEVIGRKIEPEYYLGLYARCLVFNPRYYRETLAELKFTDYREGLFFLKKLVVFFLLRISTYVKNILVFRGGWLNFSGYKIIDGVPTSSEVMKHNYFGKKGVPKVDGSID